MTAKAHRRHRLKQLTAQVTHAARTLILIATSLAITLLVCIVWKACWTLILTPP